MDRYYKRTLKDASESVPPNPIRNIDVQVEPIPKKISRNRIEVDLSKLPSDPSLRPRISDYDPNDQDIIRRAYLQKGPCQPSNHTFPQKKMGDKARRFNLMWFSKYRSWLEYNIKEDAAFCLYCYLFRPESGSNDKFVTGGFTNWKNSRRLQDHVGNHSSAHNEAYMKGQNLMKQNQHMETLLAQHSKKDRIDYRVRLNATLDVIRFLVRQGISFRGHDESEDSINQGNFLELLRWLADHNQEVNNVVLKNAPQNLKLTSPDIQKDIVNAIAIETVNAIIKDLDGELFAVLIDEARDTSLKEQMAIVLRNVDKKGYVTERFVGIIHVRETTAISLKEALEEFLSKHKTSITRLRGQGYDGASNMQGEFNGLKSLILKENKSAFYVHCFAHQLQLALVHVAKDLPDISAFFYSITSLVNIAGASCKHRDILRTKEAERVLKELESGELSSGQGLNQETSLKRPGDTRWGSHYGTLINLIIMFPSVVEVLEDVMEDGSRDQKGQACTLVKLMQSFDFVFTLHMMKNVLAITNDLSKALQRKDKDIVNAIALIKMSKERMQKMRDNGWDALFAHVSSFCKKHSIVIPHMEDSFVLFGRPRRRIEVITNLHHYRVDLFYLCVDKQLVELNNRFDEVNTELLLCMASLNPSDSFLAFNNEKLVRLSEFYPDDFSEQERMDLQNQLEMYEMDMKSNDDFLEVEGIAGLSKKMVETGKNIVYDLVYRLIKLSLILPVATATVERAFSAMNIVKNDLRNRMGDEWMNDCVVAYVEKDIFDSISNDAIMERFQHMRTRRGQL